MRDRRYRFLLVGLLAAAFLSIAVASQFASTDPDGLEFVAERQGFSDTAETHLVEDGPLAGYGENLAGSDGMNTAIAGLLGVAVTSILGYGVFWLVRRHASNRHSTAASG